MIHLQSQTEKTNRFIYIRVTEVETELSWTVPTYCASEEEALALAGKTWDNPLIFKLSLARENKQETNNNERKYISMSRQLPPPGNYNARRNDNIVVQESEAGALLAWVPYVLCHPDWAAFTGKHMVVIGKKDGSLATKNIETLKKVFNWDGVNPFDLEEIPMPETEDAEFELGQCFHDEFVDGEETRVTFKANWLNPIGGSTSMPVKLDDSSRREVITKWGSKFRAVSASTGGKPATKPTTAAAKPAAAAAKPAAKAAPVAPTKPAAAPIRKTTSVQKRTCNQDEVWNLLIADEKYSGMSEDEQGSVYWGKVDELFPGKNGELSPSEWGQVADALGV
ncbi:MAG: hypothetical protein KGL39_22820 [Patescibacteria group bacterium]|nr:hypothetical protein [Patescibacteria group bacterium]